MKNWCKNQKGSMAIYVTVSILSFMIILTGIFFTAASVRKNQLKTLPKIKEAYEKDLEQKEEIYEQQEALRNLEGGNFNISKGVNTPKLGTGMTPIKWDETANNGAGDWVETTINDNEWYDYTIENKKWANAKTSDGSMWVWIPRYAYQIADNYHAASSTGGTINIKFMKGTTAETSDGTQIVEYNETTTENYTKFPDGYVIHPGFEYDRTVPGIWVAKFEASQTDSGANTADYQNSTGGTSGIIKIQPDVNSWRNININDAYIKCLEYNSTLNSHLIKNTEWGAVAYLAQSSYGKNDEIWINPNSNYITGQAGTDVSVAETTVTYDYIDTSYGVNASTTGTVYGIYDMSGGANEFVSAYVDNGNENLTNNGASLVSGVNYTKNVYRVGTSDTRELNYTANSKKYGDAIYETSANIDNSYVNSWYTDYSSFPNSTNPFFIRGGRYDMDTDTGTFFFDLYIGTADTTVGFRPVLIIRRRSRPSKRNRYKFRTNN